MTQYHFSATIAETAQGLQIDYEVRNDSDLRAFVINVGVRVGPNGSNVEALKPDVERHANLVVLRSALDPIDPSVLYAFPHTELASLLSAHSTLRSSVVIPFPLKPVNLPVRTEPFGVKVEQVERVRFVLGVVRDATDIQATPREYGGTQLWQLSPQAYRYQSELTVETSAHVQVLAYE